MKSEQEFISGVWSKVTELEYEEREKQIALETNRCLNIKTAKIYSVVCICVLASILCIYFFDNIIYLIAIALFIIGYYAQLQIDDFTIRKED